MRSTILSHFCANFGLSVKLILTPCFDLASVVFWNPLEDFYEERYHRGVLCRLNYLTGEYSLDSPSISGRLPSGLSTPEAAWGFLFELVSFLIVNEELHVLRCRFRTVLFPSDSLDELNPF